MNYDHWKTGEPDDVEPCEVCGSTSHRLKTHCPEWRAIAAEIKAEECRDEPKQWDAREYDYWERLM